MQAVDLVLVARASIVGRKFDAVVADYLSALKKARLYNDGTPQPEATTP
jgi:hypothetical protein